jgi:ABC-2 type transport system ATP-binding protein
MITVENLVKRFGAKCAVDNISFEVKRGEVLGFLGPNGAGKSTTMRIVTGFMPATSGRVTIGGHDVTESPIEAKKLVGYLPESAPSYPDMTVAGFLGWAADMRGLAGAAKQSALQRVTELCFLQGVLHQSVDTLSKGFRHRTCLAQSLIHDPQVLILDEPTDGLDPNQKHEIRQLIKRMGETKAIVFSTHILEEVEACCSRAIIIDRGRVVTDGTPEQLKAKDDLAGTVTLRVHGVDAATVHAKLSQVVEAGRVTAEAEGTRVRARVEPKKRGEGGDLANAISDVVHRERWRFDELHTEEGRLDNVFRKITRPDSARS